MSAGTVLEAGAARVGSGYGYGSDDGRCRLTGDGYVDRSGFGYGYGRGLPVGDGYGDGSGSGYVRDDDGVAR